MKVNSLLLNITSEQPEAMTAFYRDVVGLAERDDFPDALDLGGSVLHIDGHSQTHGKNPQPQRHLVNLFVDNSASEQARLEAAGVQFVRKLGTEWWGAVISTFVDPDGNYCQLIEYKPQEAQAT